MGGEAIGLKYGSAAVPAAARAVRPVRPRRFQAHEDAGVGDGRRTKTPAPPSPLLRSTATSGRPRAYDDNGTAAEPYSQPCGRLARAYKDRGASGRIATIPSWLAS